MVKIQISLKELHTILAALRYYQAQGQADPANRSASIHDLASNGNLVNSLHAAAIDELCQRLNFGAT